MESSQKQNERNWVKGPWSPEEDELLQQVVKRDGPPRNWSLISKSIPGRSDLSCCLRWCNQLSPRAVEEHRAEEEDEIIVEVRRQFGNKWARLLSSDNAVKKYSTRKRKYYCSESDGGFADQLQPCRKRGTSSGSDSTAACLISPPPSQVQAQRWPLASNHNEFPSTALTLSPPGVVPHSDDLRSINDLTNSNRSQTITMFSPELMRVMQGMIREELRKYMSEED